MKFLQKINHTDIIIIAVVLIIAGGLLFRNVLSRSDVFFGESQHAVFTLETNGLRNQLIHYINVGDYVFFTDGTLIGYVNSIEIQPATGIITDDGEVFIVNSEGRSRLVLEISVNGIQTERGFFVNGSRRLAPGMEINVLSNRIFLPEMNVIERRIYE